MTVSLLTKPQQAATIVPSSALLVLQPPGHLFIESHLLTPGEYRIGSSSACEVVLEADGVAPEHVLLTVNQRGVRLQALEGNTWVNDFLVTQATVRRGDRLSFGPLTFTLRAATADDLLAQLPAQDAQPAKPIPSDPAVIEAIDEALAHVEAARGDIEPPSPIVEPTTAEVTNQSLHFGAETTVAAVDDVINPETNVAADPIDEDVAAPVELTSPALAAEIAAWQAERAADEEQLRTRQAEFDTLVAGLAERELRLASEISAWNTERASEEDQSQSRQTALTALATELDEREARLAAEIATWHAERAPEDERSRIRQSELTAFAAGLEERESRLGSWEARLIRREEFLDQRHIEFDAQRTELDHRESALTEERCRLEQIATAARKELAAEAEKQAAAWADWETTQRRLAAEINNEFAALAEVEAACSTMKARLTEDQQAWAATRSAWQTEQAEWEARRQEQQHQLAAWETEAQQQRDEISKERAQLDEQRADLQAEACQRSATHRELIEARQEVQRERRLLAEQQSALIAERETEWLDLRERRRRMDADEREIAELRRQTQELRNEAEAARNAIAPVVVAAPAIPESVEPVITQPVLESELISEVAPTWDSPSADNSVVSAEPSIETPLPPPLPVMLNIPLEAGAPAEEAPQQNWMESRFESYTPSENSPSAPWDVNFEVRPSVGSFSDDPIDNQRSPIVEEFALNHFDNQWPAETSPIVEPWEIDHHAGMNPTAVEGLGAPGESISFEQTQPNSDEAEPDSLRAQLAEMFGLPQDFGHHPSHADEPANFASIESLAQHEAIAFAEPELNVDGAELETNDDTASDNENDAWRTQLAAMLSAPKSPPLPEPVATEPETTAPLENRTTPPPIPTPAQPAPPQEDDSITAYMERLLARNKMGSTTPGESPSAVAAQPENAAVVPRYPVETMAEPGTAPGPVVTVPTVSLPLPEPRQRVDKEEVRAALQSFREVANLSARTAIAEHGTKTLRGEVTVQGVLAGLAGVAAGAYLLPPLWGGAMQPWPGVGCLIAAGWMGWQISQSLHRLKTWHPNDHLEVENTEEMTEENTVETLQAEATPDSEMTSNAEVVRESDVMNDDGTIIDEGVTASDNDPL